MPLPSFEGSSVQSVLWDVLDPHVFLVVDGAAMYQYKYLSMTVTGPRLMLLGKVMLPASHTPVVLRNRMVTCRCARFQGRTAVACGKRAVTYLEGQMQEVSSFLIRCTLVYFPQEKVVQLGGRGKQFGYASGRQG